MTRPNMDVLGPAISIAPMDRPGTAQEVADAVLFLSSSKATFVQGAAMVVDGGESFRSPSPPLLRHALTCGVVGYTIN